MSYNNPAPYRVIPTSGGTITLPSFDGPILAVILVPAGLLLTLNIVFPTAVDGQFISISTSQAVTTVGMTSAVGTILGALLSLTATGSGLWTWSTTDLKWFKCG